ncbi:TPA: hypothetical protein P1K40_000324 [Clostridioides difficile]|nr:hypothetical protein [Clostridioides difficile]
MSERAYSIEKGINITAKKASQLASKNELLDKRKFRCPDKNCQIGLTCSNWGKTNGKKYYFRPSSNTELHIIGCSEISPLEEKNQIILEKNGAKNTIAKNGLIKMTKSVNKMKTDICEHNISKNDLINKSHKKPSSDTTKTRKECRNLYSLDSFVELYNDNDVDHNKKFIMIDNELLSLDELFVGIQSKFEFDKNRIFFGKAKLSTGFKEGMLQIDFVNYKNLRVFSNIDSISKRSSTRILNKYIDTDYEVYVYLRGKIILDRLKEKFIPYNESVYKDFYCSE